MHVQLWNGVRLHMLIHIIGCVIVLVRHILYDRRCGDPLRAVSLVDGLGELLDGEGQIEQLVHTQIGVAHFRLAKAQDNVSRQNLVGRHHCEDMLPLVKHATLGNRNTSKLQAGSRHQL